MPATKGDLVKVEYTGTLEDGTQFDTSEESGPIEFRIGEGEVIPGFEQAVMGLEVGDKTTVTLKPEQAYGDRDDELLARVPKDAFEAGVEAGCVVGLANENGEPVGEGVITEVGDKEVTIDLNHPLAGHTLKFEIQLDAIGELAQ